MLPNETELEQLYGQGARKVELEDLLDTLARGNPDEIKALEGPLLVRVPQPGEGGNVEAIAADFRAAAGEGSRMTSVRLPRKPGGWTLLGLRKSLRQQAGMGG